MLFHTIRFTQQLDWQPFGNVNEAAAGADKSFRSVACAELGGDLHAIATDEEGLLWHTIRFSDEPSWQPFGNASAAAGKPDARFSQIACSTVNGDLHVVGCTTGGEILHTIRFTDDPRWQPFGSVSAILGRFPQDEPRGRISGVSCAGIGGDLHVCVGLFFSV